MSRARMSAAYAEGLWAKWPSPKQWPAVLDLYEAAAYLRVSYNYMWRLCQLGRDGKAQLAHRRIGALYRIARRDLDALGQAFEGRAAA